MRSTVGRLQLAMGLFAAVSIAGTVGYYLLGLSLIDAIYMTVITVTTTGYTQIEPAAGATTAYKVFTILLSIGGVSTALYTFTIVLQAVVEGQLAEALGRRRMDRKISNMNDHVVLCGWGRVGKAVAHDLALGDREVVVVDLDPDRIRDIPHHTVVGDATLDTTLRAAGVERASSLVAALEGDAENLFVTLSARALKPDLFIVARARADESIVKLSNAGADRVVNPQELGAARMASFVIQPNVAEFVDVVMHERSMDFRMQEVALSAESPLAGLTLREANLRQYAPVLVLALRDSSGTFNANPSPDVELHAGNVIIVVGTNEALEQLAEML